MASFTTSQLFTMSTSVRTTSWLSGTFMLRDGASAGANWTVSPSFTRTLLCASQAPGRVIADSADATATMANTPSTSHLCLNTAYKKLRTAIRPVAVRCLTEVLSAVPDAPTIACGGIATAEDARAALALGAVAVQVGTALLHDPTTAHRLANELAANPVMIGEDRA